MSAPTVTAIVATRDRPVLLRRAVRSILTQDYDGEIECVVVHDGAPEDAEDLGDLASETRAGRGLRVVPNRRTPGLAGARNTGATEAVGDLLAFCDDDDEWLPDKLRAQVAALGESAVAVTGIEIVVQDRRTVRVPQGPVTRAHLLRSRAAEVHPSTIVVRRDAFEGPIGPLDEALPGSYGEDYEWLLRAAAEGPIAVVPRPLVRVHWGGSLFADRWDTMADAIAYLIRKHPDVVHDSRNAARLYGRLAFARAAAGRRREAVRWARRSLGRRPFERRPYLALAVACGVLRPSTILQRANRAGRGV